jgi:N-acetylmuramoyl-L-alanine amidase
MRVPAALFLVLSLVTAAGSSSALAAGGGSQELAMAAPIWNRTPVVGLQVGHWQAQALPKELADLRDNPGAVRDGYRELDANLAVTRAAAAVLRTAGVKVDILPATIPAGYQADAFVAIHADQDVGGQHWRGYKTASSALSQDKPDSRLLSSTLGATYADETGLPPDTHAGAISPDMRFYYAFNWQDFQHAIDPQTPAAIIELGFVSDQTDRDLLFGRPDQAGQAVADGILRFLQGQGSLVPDSDTTEP